MNCSNCNWQNPGNERLTEVMKLLLHSATYRDQTPGREHITGFVHALRCAGFEGTTEEKFVALVHDLARPLNDAYHGEVISWKSSANRYSLTHVRIEIRERVVMTKKPVRKPVDDSKDNKARAARKAPPKREPTRRWSDEQLTEIAVTVISRHDGRPDQYNLVPLGREIVKENPWEWNVPAILNKHRKE